MDRYLLPIKAQQQTAGIKLIIESLNNSIFITLIVSLFTTRLDKSKNCLEYDHKFRQKCKKFTNFQKLLKEKDQNIHLSYKCPLKLQRFSLQ